MKKSYRQPRRMHRLIAFKAFEDTDRDILDWWESHDEGERSDALRELIREHVTGKPRPLGKGEQLAVLAGLRDDMASIREALHDLPAYLERMVQAASIPALPARADGEGTESPAGPGLSPEDLSVREQKLRARQW